MEFVALSTIQTSISVGSERKRKGRKGALCGTDGAQYGADESGAGSTTYVRVNSIVCLVVGDGSSCTARSPRAEEHSPPTDCLVIIILTTIHLHHRHHYTREQGEHVFFVLTLRRIRTGLQLCRCFTVKS